MKGQPHGVICFDSIARITFWLVETFQLPIFYLNVFQRLHSEKNGSQHVKVQEDRSARKWYQLRGCVHFYIFSHLDRCALIALILSWVLLCIGYCYQGGRKQGGSLGPTLHRAWECIGK